MLKKILLIALVTLMLCNTTSAIDGSMMVTDVNVGKLVGAENQGGAGFITTDTQIVWTISDANTSAMAGFDYNVTITYSATKGAAGTVIVSDLNLGDVNAGTGYCTSGPKATGAASTRHCEYTWTAAAVNAITDGNYFIDVNVEVWHEADLFLLYDANMDTNNSFYIDNAGPECKIESKADNKFEWVVEYDVAQALGSQTTLYYSVVSEGKDPSYSSSVTNLIEGTVSDGKYDYACYATDSAGNTSGVDTATMQWPAEGGIVVVSRGAGAAPAAVIGIVGDIAADPVGFAAANPLFVVIGVAAIYLLFFSKKKRKKKGR